MTLICFCGSHGGTVVNVLAFTIRRSEVWSCDGYRLSQLFVWKWVNVGVCGPVKDWTRPAPPPPSPCPSPSPPVTVEKMNTWMDIFFLLLLSGVTVVNHLFLSPPVGRLLHCWTVVHILLHWVPGPSLGSSTFPAVGQLHPLSLFRVLLHVQTFQLFPSHRI